MPATGNRLLSRRKLVQQGKETTKGTAVVATHQTVFPWTFTPVHPVNRPKGLRGYTMRNSGDETVESRATRLALAEYPFAFEEFHRLLAMSVRGGAFAATQESAGTDPNAYKWLAERLRSDAPDPVTYTFETLEHDGTAGIAKKFPFSFLTDWTVNYDPSGLLTVAANGWAQRDVDMSGAITVLGSYPAAVTHIQGARTTFARDVLWANIGVTTFGYDLQKATVKFDSGFKPLRGMVNDTNLNFDQVLFDPDASGITIDVELRARSNVADLFAILKAAAESQAGQAVRLEFQGDIISGGASLRFMLRVDAYVKVEAGSLWVSGAQDGQQTVGVKLVETAPLLSTDPWVSVFLRNNKATATL